MPLLVTVQKLTTITELMPNVSNVLINVKNVLKMGVQYVVETEKELLIVVVQ